MRLQAAQNENRRADPAVPKHYRLVERSDSEVTRTSITECPRHGKGSVPVSVRLDDAQDRCGPTGQLLQMRIIRTQRIEINDRSATHPSQVFHGNRRPIPTTLHFLGHRHSHRAHHFRELAQSQSDDSQQN